MSTDAQGVRIQDAEGIRGTKMEYLHDDSDAGNEVRSLLADLGALVVQAPLDRTTDLGAGRAWHAS